MMDSAFLALSSVAPIGILAAAVAGAVEAPARLPEAPYSIGEWPEKEGKTLIVLASWAAEKADVNLSIDWEALGLDPDRAKLVAEEMVYEWPGGDQWPAGVNVLQPQREFQPGETIPVEPAEGWFLSLEDDGAAPPSTNTTGPSVIFAPNSPDDVDDTHFRDAWTRVS